MDPSRIATARDLIREPHPLDCYWEGPDAVQKKVRQVALYR